LQTPRVNNTVQLRRNENLPLLWSGNRHWTHVLPSSVQLSISSFEFFGSNTV